MPNFEIVNIHDSALWTARQGHGPALVCCHGGPGLWDYLEPVAAMVDDLATVYRYDQRSCGRSTGSPPYDVATAVTDLEALRAHWQLEQWTLFGHSWGATLALAYCLAHPSRVRALIYHSGIGIDAAWKAEYARNKAALLHPDEQRQIDELRAQLPLLQGTEYDETERAYCELSWSIDFADRSRGRELARQLFVSGQHINFEVNKMLGQDSDRFAQQKDMPEQLANLHIPTLVIHGALDPRSARFARHLAACIPSAIYIEIPNVGHMAWIEQPERTREILRAFLERIL